MAALAARFALSAEQAVALAQYVDLLLGWQLGNVTGVRERDAVIDKLLGDSLALLEVVDGLGGSEGLGGIDTTGGGTVAWADLGSGAGLPGIPLAVARPAVEVTLIESVGKKCVFLEAAVAAAGLAARVHVVRARSEEAAAVGATLRERFSLVLARALAPLGTVCELAAPLLARGGYLVASTTSTALEVERARGEAAGAACGLAARGYPPLKLSPLTTSVAAVFEKAAPTPEWLPRRPGLARARPLG